MTGSLLERELSEQPDVMADLVLRRAPGLLDLGARLADGDSHLAVIAARGSSDNAARYAKYLLGDRLGWPVALAAPSLHSRYGAQVSYEHAMVVAISQSGRSPDVVGVIEEARRQRRPTLAITNAPDSPLADAAEHVVDLGAGEERSVAATKTYTSSLMAIAGIAAGMDPATERASTLEALAAVPSHVAAAIEAATAEDAAGAILAGAGRSFAVGRGYNLSTAFEIALKITELTGTSCRPFSSADLLHGPIAAAGQGVPVLVVAPSGRVVGDLADVIPQLQDRGARCIVLSDDPGVRARGEVGIELASSPEWLSPIVAVAAGQVLAVDAARRRGVKLDTPHGLTKVTETR